MSNTDYDNWIEKRIDELIHKNVQIEGLYDEEIIRDYLIFSQYGKSGEKLIKFFTDNRNNEALLKVLFQILLDESEDYSNDSRYVAAKIIPLFETDILRNYKKELVYAQNYNIVNLRPFKGDYPNWLKETLPSVPPIN